MGDSLNKPSKLVYRHNLTSILDDALRSSNAESLPQHVLGRVGVRLYDPSPGDSGWDIFSLDYAIDGPLCCIVNSKALAEYRKIFHLLWRLKRIEWALNDAWRRSVRVQHMLSRRGRGMRRKMTGAWGEIEGVLKRVGLARQ